MIQSITPVYTYLLVGCTCPAHCLDGVYSCKDVSVGMPPMSYVYPSYKSNG